MAARDFPGVELRVQRMRVGEGVRIGEGTVIVADDLVLGDGAVIGPGCDLRSARLEVGAGGQVGEGSRWLVADEAVLGVGTVVDAGADVVCRQWSVGEGSYLGRRLRVGAGASMEENSVVQIGHRCQIAPDVTVNPTEPVLIGDEVGISAEVAIFTHGYHAGHPVRDGHGAAFAGVEVEDGAWLGFRAVLLPGVRVGAGTVVAASATVSRSLPAGVLAAGVPARVKRVLEPVALDAAARREAVAGLLEAWMQRLRFKGLKVEATGARRAGLCWRVTGSDSSDRCWQVAWCPQDGELPGVAEVRRSGAATGAVFEFGEPLAVRGVLDDLGHDLRDFLRRATWLFPYAGNSRGLVPERFARLLG
ncbi:acyltransferase [Streptomyces sp. NPDC004549]|uniref:acyltransferase n=1 Tax=Streptomyces sp. NPDC004549 TaxID=3154283 RepID=UPI0033AF7E03